MASCERQTQTSDASWPNWRDALSYRLGYLQATVDIMQAQQKQSPPISGGWMQRTIAKAKLLWTAYEMGSKLWAWQRRLALPILIASWWDSLIWLVRLLLG